MINPTYFNIMNSKEYIDKVSKIKKAKEENHIVPEIKDDSVAKANNESSPQSAPECATCPFKDTDRCKTCLTGMNLYV